MREKGGARGGRGWETGTGRKDMKMTTARTEIAPVEIGKAARHFVYYCPKLDLWAVGRTKEEAETTLREEIRLLLARCRDYLDGPESLSGNGYATVEIRPS
jgi:hypothetical protein